MTSLDTLTPAAPESVAAALPQILAAAGSGSVITRDHAVGILIKLSALKAAPENQTPHVCRAGPPPGRCQYRAQAFRRALRPGLEPPALQAPAAISIDLAPKPTGPTIYNYQIQVCTDPAFPVVPFQPPGMPHMAPYEWPSLQE